MKIGSVYIDVALVNGQVLKNQAIGGVEINGIKNCVINHTDHVRQEDGSWIHKGKTRDIPLSHNEMIHKIHNATRNTKRFHTWVSTNTLNICDKKLVSLSNRSPNNPVQSNGTKVPGYINNAKFIAKAEFTSAEPWTQPWTQPTKSCNW